MSSVNISSLGGMRPVMLFLDPRVKAAPFLPFLSLCSLNYVQLALTCIKRWKTYTVKIKAFSVFREEIRSAFDLR